MTVGERIRAARKKKGLTQKALGQACGIAEPTIRRYELGKLNPKYQTLEKIAVALDTTASTLLGVGVVNLETWLKKQEERDLFLQNQGLHLSWSNWVKKDGNIQGAEDRELEALSDMQVMHLLYPLLEGMGVLVMDSHDPEAPTLAMYNTLTDTAYIITLDQFAAFSHNALAALKEAISLMQNEAQEVLSKSEAIDRGYSHIFEVF